MPNDRDIQLLKEARNSQFEEASEPKRGKVIEVNGTIFGTLPNTVWVQPLDENSSPRQVFNPGTILNLQNGSPVYYRQTPKPPAPWELVNFDLGLYAPSASTYANLFQLNVPPHASLHELRAGFPGPDSLNVHPHAVVDLSIRPTIPNSMQVRIYGGWYAASDGTYKYLAGPTNSSDLTASIPGSAGYSKIIAFLLNRLTGVVSTVSGSDYVEGTTPVYPSVTTDFILLSAVRLTNGMTAIGNRNFDREMRAIVGNTGAGGFWKDAGGGAIYYDGGDVGIGGIPERPLDFYGGSSHSGSFRIRGSTPATELVDLYVGSTGIFYVDFTNSGEAAPYLEVRPTDDEYGLKVTAPGSASAFLNIFVTDATPDVVNLTASNVGGTNGIFLTSDGAVGIGTIPDNIFHISVATGAAGIELFKLESSNEGGYFSVADGASTGFVPTFIFLSAGLSGIGGQIQGQVPVAQDIFSATRAAVMVDGRRDSGAALTASNLFNVRNFGSVKLTVDVAGKLGVGIVASMSGKAHIDQSSTTAAMPVLTLDQADLSEEFIEFAATVGAGNPIDTAAIGTYYGKIRVSVAGVGFKYIPLHNS